MILSHIYIYIYIFASIYTYLIVTYSGIVSFGAKIFASDPTPHAQFGYSVSINSGHVLVGSPGIKSNGIDSGAAYIFTTDANWKWYLAKRFVANDTRPYMR